ncbi:hypothetical protein [Clostridium weizhouense]|uniref:Uncharacterized protein n=1 Tax=Clostridium weizhouense TaxID=2859781 RepID=A0ABS7AS14_9CLOT|nr:hypothetical protein [Clostridium weizhouense]MBW6411334.1 hypothetical protein [Clostridium weizhouense]
MKFIINALILFGIIWLLIFLGTLFGLIGLMILRIFMIVGIPALIIWVIYKLFKR